MSLFDRQNGERRFKKAMSEFARGAITGLRRNWRMLLIAVVAVIVALSSPSGGAWTRTIAMTFVAVGVVLNLVVICANGGRMPAWTEEVPSSHEGDYRIMDEGTRLWFLGDWIPVRDWLLSPGDVFLYTGLVVVIAARLLGHLVGVT